MYEALRLTVKTDEQLKLGMWNVYKDSHAYKIPCEHLCMLTIANMAKVRKFGTLNVSGMCT